jgi:alkylation response protein AidB-like acyl-CoA dehydrogenase
MTTSVASKPYMPICGDDYPLTEKQKHLMAMAHDLGQNKFAPRAAQLDRDAQFPFENYKDMKAAGLLALCVPEAHGGQGADYATYAMVSAEIGRWCGATALTFNMHVCTMMWSGLLSEDLDMTPEQRALHRVHQKSHFARVVNEGAIYAQPFSEGGASAAGAQPFGTQAVKVEGGWKINGKKSLHRCLMRQISLACCALRKSQMPNCPDAIRFIWPYRAQRLA